MFNIGIYLCNSILLQTYFVIDIQQSITLLRSDTLTKFGLRFRNLLVIKRAKFYSD